MRTAIRKLPPRIAGRLTYVTRSRGGSDRPANLALSCHACNSAKGNQSAEVFGHPEVQTQAKQPLRDAAAVNSTRRALHQRLLTLGLPVETASGGLTKWNRTQRGVQKTHWLDAVCVGSSTPERIQGWRDVVPLAISAQRWRRRQMCLMNDRGFPRTKAKGASRAYGSKTGDRVKAVVPTGKPRGTHVATWRSKPAASLPLEPDVVPMLAPMTLSAIWKQGAWRFDCADSDLQRSPTLVKVHGPRLARSLASTSGRMPWRAGYGPSNTSYKPPVFHPSMPNACIISWECFSASALSHELDERRPLTPDQQ